MFISTLSLTSALDVVRGQRHALAVLPPGKLGKSKRKSPVTGLEWRRNVTGI